VASSINTQPEAGALNTVCKLLNAGLPGGIHAAQKSQCDMKICRIYRPPTIPVQ
jgi:hypothetical protein